MLAARTGNAMKFFGLSRNDRYALDQFFAPPEKQRAAMPRR
jgi:hypothetical protein